MKSMTGFGRAVAECGDFRVCVDVSSVNKKGLELSVSLPRQWQPLERLVAAKVREFYSRGKVNVAFKVDFKNRAADIFADTQALKSAFGALKKRAKKSARNLPRLPTR